MKKKLYRVHHPDKCLKKSSQGHESVAWESWTRAMIFNQESMGRMPESCMCGIVSKGIELFLLWRIICPYPSPIFLIMLFACL